ncbi:MAG: hypothetical protein IJ796_05450 [Lachnospiraceae bacterium]|nr:hypothetical protein [Lachnospiraceae bacterium]
MKKVKEFFRKRMVALKRKPQTIPMIVLIVTFLIYSLNLRIISDTTARINMTGMGLAGFVTMLLSILSFVCFLNAFPHRKPVNVPMLVLFFIMQIIIGVCNRYYLSKITLAIVNEGAKAADMLKKNLFIAKAYKMLGVHFIFLIITVALVALLPLYSKLLRKIKTSIDVAGNESMGEIEISSEE